MHLAHTLFLMSPHMVERNSSMLTDIVTLLSKRRGLVCGLKQAVLPVAIFALPFCQQLIFPLRPTSSLDQPLVDVGRHRHRLKLERLSDWMLQTLTLRTAGTAFLGLKAGHHPKSCKTLEQRRCSLVPLVSSTSVWDVWCFVCLQLSVPGPVH